MEKNNFTEKSINEFNSHDTIYIQKSNHGFITTFLLKFKSFSKGIVTGEILDIQPNNQRSIWIGKGLFKIGSDISGKISKCYTFKAGKGCCWFEKNNNNEWKSK